MNVQSQISFLDKVVAEITGSDALVILEKADAKAEVGDVIQLTEAFEDWSSVTVEHFFKEFLT